MYTKTALTLLFCILGTLGYSQNDTVYWTANLRYNAENKQEKTPDANFHVAYRPSLPNHSDTEPITIKIHSLYDSSWFSPQVPDTLEQRIFFLLYCKAELWRRKTNLWLWENGDLPEDYQLAMIEHLWESEAKNIQNTKKAYYNTGKISTLEDDISATLSALYEYENNEEASAVSAFGYGMDFFFASGTFLDGQFKSPRGIGIGLLFSYRKTALNLEGTFIYSSTNEEIEANNTIWQKGQPIQHGTFSIQLQQKIIATQRISISPYAGVTFSEIVPADSLSNSNLTYTKTQRLHGTSYIVGVNSDIMLMKKSDLAVHGIPPSYWLLRLGAFYTPFNYGDKIKSQFLGIKIGFGGFGKFTQ